MKLSRHRVIVLPIRIVSRNLHIFWIPIIQIVSTSIILRRTKVLLVINIGVIVKSRPVLRIITTYRNGTNPTIVLRLNIFKTEKSEQAKDKQNRNEFIFHFNPFKQQYALLKPSKFSTTAKNGTRKRNSFFRKVESLYL